MLFNEKIDSYKIVFLAMFILWMFLKYSYTWQKKYIVYSKGRGLLNSSVKKYYIKTYFLLLLFWIHVKEIS